MKKILFIIITMLMCKANIAFAQKIPRDSVDYYIKTLSWESLYLKTNYVTTLVLSRDAERLVPAGEKKTVRALLSQISNESKTVAIHMILSKTFEPESRGIGGEYVYRHDSVVGINYTYNRLKWRYDVADKKYSIAPGDVQRIERYWKKKLNKKYSKL